MRVKKNKEQANAEKVKRQEKRFGLPGVYHKFSIIFHSWYFTIGIKYNKKRVG